MNNRRFKLFILVIFLQLATGCMAQQSRLSGLEKTGLVTLDGSAYLLPTENVLAIAIVFLSPECPLSQNYCLVLNNLQKKYKDQVKIIGVFPGDEFDDSTCSNFQQKYKVGFQLVKDPVKKLTRMIGATITPEVFLLDSNRKILYKGAIDDWVVSLGQKKAAPENNYLENAIRHYTDHQVITPSVTRAIGCFINE